MKRFIIGASLLASAALLSASPAAAFNPPRADETRPWYAQPYSAQPYAAQQYNQSYALQSYGPTPINYAATGIDPLGGASIAYGSGAYVPQATAIPRQIVNVNFNHKPGTIVISTEERRLYYVLGNGEAIQYAVGVGRPGFEWSGTQVVSRKAEWPDWRPPSEMLRRRPDLPRYMAGGPENPLGARAMYLGSTLYRIHGSNEPDTIGQAVSSGCIRMTNDDVTDLYSRVKIGSRVVVL